MKCQFGEVAFGEMFRSPRNGVVLLIVNSDRWGKGNENDDAKVVVATTTLNETTNAVAVSTLTAIRCQTSAPVQLIVSV